MQNFSTTKVKIRFSVISKDLWLLWAKWVPVYCLTSLLMCATLAIYKKIYPHNEFGLYAVFFLWFTILMCTFGIVKFLEMPSQNNAFSHNYQRCRRRQFILEFYYIHRQTLGSKFVYVYLYTFIINTIHLYIYHTLHIHCGMKWLEYLFLLLTFCGSFVDHIFAKKFSLLVNTKYSWFSVIRTRIIYTATRIYIIVTMNVRNFIIRWYMNYII